MGMIIEKLTPKKYDVMEWNTQAGNITPNLKVKIYFIHVSDPIRSTVCTTALKNIPDTLGFAPSICKINDNRTKLFLELCRFLTNSVQS